METVRWQKSSRSSSNGGDCVETARPGSQRIAARDSKNPGGPQLRFALSDWQMFLAEVKRGRFDL